MKPDASMGPLLTPGRRRVLWAGVALIGLGFLLFFSTFVTFAMHFGDFDHFEEHARSDGLRAVGGMGLILVGIGLTIAATLGQAARWAADPDRAARDLAPWARLSGRLQDEAFSEMRTVRATVADLAGARSAPSPPAPEPVIKVRCRGCGALSDESSRFCGGCGAPL